MFESRASESEFLDHPDCDADLARASYRFMERVNLLFGGIRVVRRFLAKAALEHTGPRPLRILDIGSGSCDIPLALSRWSRRCHLNLHFTCLEPAGPAARIARKRLDRADDPAIQLLQENAFDHHPAEPYDHAIISMCAHHFDNDTLVALIRRLRVFIRGSVLINDLLRTPFAVAGARLLTIGAPEGVRHDALLSVRRGFTVRELREILQSVEAAEVVVETAWAFRIAATVRFIKGPLEK